MITIPKLGLKHHQLLKEVKDLDENLKILLDSICPGLTHSEAEVVMLHLLEFNGKLHETEQYQLKDLKVNVKTEFTLNGHVYKFREPLLTEKFADEVDLLKKTYSDTPPDFGEFPAFVHNWAKQIMAPLTLGDLVGSSAILDKLAK